MYIAGILQEKIEIKSVLADEKSYRIIIFKISFIILI